LAFDRYYAGHSCRFSSQIQGQRAIRAFNHLSLVLSIPCGCKNAILPTASTPLFVESCVERRPPVWRGRACRQGGHPGDSPGLPLLARSVTPYRDVIHLLSIAYKISSIWFSTAICQARDGESPSQMLRTRDQRPIYIKSFSINIMWLSKCFLSTASTPLFVKSYVSGDPPSGVANDVRKHRLAGDKRRTRRPCERVKIMVRRTVLILRICTQY
jgi:hypothetical protein